MLWVFLAQEIKNFIQTVFLYPSQTLYSLDQQILIIKWEAVGLNQDKNLVFDSNGYIKVTDFGIAKTYQRENAHETSGTPSYMAPEVIFKQNHSYESDFYALGVIAHELMLNKRPYKGRTRKELKEQMLHKKIKIRNSQCPRGWDT